MLAEILLGGERRLVTLHKVPRNDRHANGQALAGLQLRNKGEHFPVFWHQVVVELAENEQLWSPVLGVRLT